MEFIDENEFKKEIGIYKITNLINKKVYIGQTKEGFQRRFWLHRWQLRNNAHDNKHLQSAWNKYGEENFSFEVIKICKKEDVDEEEKKFIKFYRENGPCYNIQDGGQPCDFNSYISPEIRKRVGEQNRKRMTGSKLSEETKNKMSETRKGKRVYRKSDSLTNEQVISIKKMFISGATSREIMDILNVEYKPVNAILSNNAYFTVFVEDWDSFLEKHKKEVQDRKQRGKEIIELYKSGLTVQQIADKLNWEWHCVKYYINKLKQQSTRQPLCQASNEEGATTIRKE